MQKPSWNSCGLASNSVGKINDYSNVSTSMISRYMEKRSRLKIIIYSEIQRGGTFMDFLGQKR